MRYTSTISRSGRAALRGFSLVTAIFLLVVLALLGAMMAAFFSTQQQSAALDVLGSRAYQAARAGAEWAVYEVAQMPPATQSVPATLWPGCATGTTFSVLANSLDGTLAPFTVAVTCTASAVVEGNGPTPTLYTYDVTSTATGVNGAQRGSADYVERVINVKIAR